MTGGVVGVQLLAPPSLSLRAKPSALQEALYGRLAHPGVSQCPLRFPLTGSKRSSAFFPALERLVEQGLHSVEVEGNRAVRTGTKSAVRSVRTAVQAGDAETSEAALKKAESVLRRAASKGVIPKKRASRQISRLVKSRNQISTG